MKFLLDKFQIGMPDDYGRIVPDYIERIMYELIDQNDGEILEGWSIIKLLLDRKLISLDKAVKMSRDFERDPDRCSDCSSHFPLVDLFTELGGQLHE